jgi:hypothetical protein
MLGILLTLLSPSPSLLSPPLPFPVLDSCQLMQHMKEIPEVA